MRSLALLVFVIVLVGAIWLARRSSTETPEPAPAAPSAAGFVGSETCKGCHEERHATWLKTAHAYSLREATEATVAGKFDGRAIRHSHFVATPYRNEGGYYIKVDRQDGLGPGNHQVTRVVGRSFEQAYLTTTAQGEWRVLPLAWSLERGEWDLTHEVLSDISGHLGAALADWDSREYVFNDGCGQCHATDYAVGHELRADGRSFYQSTFLEGAVACESCHGPGSIHVEWHQRDPAPDPGDYAAPARLVHPADDLDAQQVLDSCGRCHYTHEWRYAIAADPLVSYRQISITNNTLKNGFFADGRLNGMNYHGSTQSQSACFLRGAMSCLDCHRLHSGRKWAMKFDPDGDAQCTQCHQDVADRGAEHSFHEAGGVSCVDCHMPRLRKGVLHFMRDHSIRSPEPELTERFGAAEAPNACNVCHADQDAAWARTWKEKWWGKAPPRLVQNVATMVGLRTDPPSVPSPRLVEIAESADNLLFFRLTAIRHLGHRGDAEGRACLRRLLADPHPEVVQLACEMFGETPDRLATPGLTLLLDSDIRPTRVGAAFALARAGWRGRSDAMARALRDAVEMLVRQRQFLALLTRIALIADAQGNREVFLDHHERVWRLVNAGARSPAATQVLHRQARQLTESGEHGPALEAYAELRPLYAPEFSPLMMIDSADSLAALGRDKGAVANWQTLVVNLKEGGVLHAIAEARLAATSGRIGAEAGAALLEKFEKSLAGKPATQELLRRVRWSLQVIRARLARK